MGNYIPLCILSGTSVPSDSNFDDPWVWGKVIVFLLVLGIIAFFLNYLSKQKGVKTMVGGKNNLRIVDTCSLGNRQFIVVTQYESERHLLAVSTSGISHLAKLSSQSSPHNDAPNVTD